LLQTGEPDMPRPILDEAQHPRRHPRTGGQPPRRHRQRSARCHERHAGGGGGHEAEPLSAQGAPLLDAAGIPYQYLEYGSYFSRWRERNALKMWCGWPTLPMVFVKGVLIGGADDLARLLASGELQRLLA
jgi:monothiol glutaredoxin